MSLCKVYLCNCQSFQTKCRGMRIAFPCFDFGIFAISALFLALQHTIRFIEETRAIVAEVFTVSLSLCFVFTSLFFQNLSYILLNSHKQILAIPWF